MAGPSWWCCCQGCWVFVDEFDEADSTDLSSDWNETDGLEVNGDWGIRDQMLIEEWSVGTGTGGTANALVFCTRAIPASDDNGMRVAVTAVDASIGDKFHIYVACRSSEQVGTGVKIEYEKVSADGWVTTIDGGGVDGVSETQTASPQDPGGRGVILWACADHMTEMISAGIISLSGAYAWADELDPGDGRYAALGHDSSVNGVKFDDFYMGEMRTPTVVCNDCWCWCLDRPPKRHLIGTVFGATGRAECMDGISWELDWEWNVGIPRWKGTAWFPDEAEPGTATATVGYIPVVFYLTCSGADDDVPEHPGKNFTLTSSGSCLFTTLTKVALDSSTCDPLSLEFGPYTLSYSDLTCNICWPSAQPASCMMNPTGPNCSGEFYIVVTE